MINLSFHEQIDLFFSLPDKRPKSIEKINSSLCLLRQDLAHCLANSSESWPALMCIMAGIDLVAKFYSNNDDRNSGKRFKKYLQFMSLDSGEAELVYQCRNAIMHSFGLYSEDRSGKYFFHPRMQWPYVVRQTKKLEARHIEIGIIPLNALFESSLPRLKQHLLNATPINFTALFMKYGSDKPLFENGNMLDICNINYRPYTYTE